MTVETSSPPHPFVPSRPIVPIGISIEDRPSPHAHRVHIEASSGVRIEASIEFAAESTAIHVLVVVRVASRIADLRLSLALRVGTHLSASKLTRT